MAEKITKQFMMRQEKIQLLKKWIIGADEKTLFELRRGFSMVKADWEWLRTLPQESYDLLASLLVWEEVRENISRHSEFRDSMIYQYSEEERKQWISSGNGRLEKILFWTEKNRDWVKQSMDILSHSVRIREPVDTRQYASIGVQRAQAVVSFDLVYILRDSLARITKVRQGTMLVDQWVALIRQGVEKLKMSVMLYSSSHSRGERFDRAMQMPPGVMDLRVKRASDEWTLSAADYWHFFSYCKQHGEPWMQEEFDRIGEYYFPWAKNTQHYNLFMVFTSMCYSPRSILEELFNFAGNYYYKTMHIHVLDGFDLGLGSMPTTPGTMVELMDYPKMEYTMAKDNFMDVRACMDRKVMIPDIENLIVIKLKELSHRALLANYVPRADIKLHWPEENSAYFCPAVKKDLEVQIKKVSGQPFYVTCLADAAVCVNNLHVSSVYWIKARDPIKRVSISVGSPTWEEPVLNQPMKSLAQDGKDLTVVQFSLDSILQNVWVMIQTEKGYGIRCFGSYDLKISTTDLSVRTSGYIARLRSPDKGESFNFLMNVAPELMGIWVRRTGIQGPYKDARRSTVTEVYYPQLETWRPLVGACDEVNIPLTRRIVHDDVFVESIVSPCNKYVIPGFEGRFVPWDEHPFSNFDDD